MELLRIKKKYSIKYVLTAKLFEVYLVFLILIICSIVISEPILVVGLIILLVFIMMGALIFSKQNAAHTYIVFYEDKVVYKRKFLFMNKEKEMKYENIADIGYNQGTSWVTRFFQKIYHFGNIYIYPKKGNLLFNGICLEVVENIEDVANEIKEKISDKIIN